jgi:hypothetical protein
MEQKTTLSHLNEMIKEDLITEGIITGRDGLCGSWKNPEMFPRKPFQVKCNRFFCPVCSVPKINNIRRNVSSFTNEFQRDGGNLNLITLTIPHNKNTDLNDLYNSFSKSTRRMKNSSVWRNSFKKELNSQFHFNRYETTINPRNDYHLHLHITIGGYNLIDTDLWKERLTEVWRRCCESVGVKRLPTKTNGVDIRLTTNGTYSMKQNEDTNIPTKQDSYSPEDLKKILTGYKRIEQFKHPDFSLKELKKYLKKYKKVMSGKKYMKIYFDNDDYKWKWNQNRTTIEDFLI